MAILAGYFHAGETAEPNAQGGSGYAPTSAERTARARIADERYLPGDVRRYTRVGESDHTRAIQDALNAAGMALLPKGRYDVSDRLRFRTQGQMIMGEGPSVSVIRYGGRIGGAVLSVCDGSINHSDCTIANLTIDGGGRANVGIEGYDDAVPGGSWRTAIENVAVIGVSHGSDATAIRLGTGRWPNFAHDTRIDRCYLYGAARGVWGAGAKYALSRCTLFQMKEAGCFAPLGSAWTIAQCVFTRNGWDFQGTDIQQADFSGCWFEDSANGIYRAEGAHSVSFTGCVLHTDSAACLMDFGAAAGYHMIAGHFVPVGSKSERVLNINSRASGAVLGQPLQLVFESGARAPAILSLQ